MKIMKITLMLLIFFALLSHQTFAQNDPVLNWRRTHDGVVRCVAYSPDNEVLASGGTDDTIRLWEVSTGDSLGILEGHSGDVNSIAFSQDGIWIASGSDDGTVRLWKQSIKGDHTTWIEYQQLEIKATFLFIFTNPLNNNAKSVAFDPDSKLLACGTSGSKVIVWHKANRQLDDGEWHIGEGPPDWEWRELQTLDEHWGDVNSVTFIPNWRLLASGSDDDRVHLWKTSELWSSKNQDPPSPWSTQYAGVGGINSIASHPTFDGSGAVYAVGGGDGAEIAYYYSFENDNKEFNPDGPPPDWIGHRPVDESPGDVQSVAFSPKGELLLVGSADGSILVSDGNTGDYRDLQIWRAGAGVNSIAFAEDTVASGGEGGVLQRELQYDVTLKKFRKVKSIAVKGISIETPTELISEVAFGSNSTYFILNLRHPMLKGGGFTQDTFHYGTCLIGLDLPNVPSIPIQPGDLLDPSDDEFERLKEPPAYFMHPLHTPLERLDLHDERYETLRNKAIDEKLLRLGITLATNVVVARIILKGGTVGTALGTVIPFVGPIVGGLVGTGVTFVVVYLVTDGVEPDSEALGEDELEILKSTADPIAVFSHALDEEAGHPEGNFETLFFIRQNLQGPPNSPNSRIIPITIQQDFQLRDAGGTVLEETYTARFEGELDLVHHGVFPDKQAAPSKLSTGTQPMALSDYPPFQQLPSEVQAYLLKYFGAFSNAKAWQIPEQTSLLPNYPNPFNPETWLPYQLSEPADVTLTIYDIQGRVVRDLNLGHQRAGRYHGRSRAAHWDGRNVVGEPVASGVYFYTLTAGEFTATRKMLIRK